MFNPEESQDSSPLNAAQWFAAACSKGGTRTALRARVQGAWAPVSWAQWGEAAHEIAAGLVAAGIRRGDRVGILGEGDPQVAMATQALALLGAICVPLAPTRSTAELGWILANAGLRAGFVDPALRNRLGPHLALELEIALPRLGGRAPAPGVHGWTELRQAGRAALAGPIGQGLHHLRSALIPADPCMLLYTAGTGDHPLGVQLSHGNVVSQGTALARAAGIRPDDEQLLTLPLSQILGQNMLWAAISATACTAFGRTSTLQRDLVEVAPTVFAAVPAVLEPLARGLRQDLEGMALGRVAAVRSLGARVSTLRQAGRVVPNHVRWGAALADRYCFAPLRARLGTRLRFVVCGGAPLGRDLAEFLHSLGILVLEGYGLTEASGALSWNRPDRFRFGTAGPVLPGWELALAHDGEILARGPGVMLGYHRRPDLPSPVDEEGFLHTGDLGQWSDGCLQWRGRKADLVPAQGSAQLAPQSLEARLESQEGIARAVVLSHGAGGLVALLDLDVPTLMVRARAEQLGCRGRGDLLEHPRVRALIGAGLARVNETQPRHGRIERFALLPHPLGVGRGELTPLGTPRRRFVQERYAALLAKAWPVPSTQHSQ